MSQLALAVSNLGKQYQIGETQEYGTLRDTIASSVTRPIRALRSWFGPNQGVSEAAADNTIWALRNASFEVKTGEAVGIIGRNGAGKSTLLKTLSRITEPTEGWAEVWGPVGSLLEVGTGFHPELTGRENTFLNGAILGMSKAEIARKFDEVVAFSEVGKFIDTPVKHYSSGMQLRLAFAVAAHLDTDVLFMDEVLAVGDAAFQKKCLRKMENVAQNGRTVLFVSHNLVAVRELCSRAIWIDGGCVRADGEVQDVIQQYVASLSNYSFQFYSPTTGLTIDRVVLKNRHDRPTTCFVPGDKLSVEIEYCTERPLARPYVIVVIESMLGRCFTANMLLDGCQPARLEGKGTLTCNFLSIPLLPQSYTVKMSIRESDGRHEIVPLQDVAAFDVAGDLGEHGLKGDFKMAAARSTPVMIPYEWVLPDGSKKVITLGRAPSRVA